MGDGSRQPRGALGSMLATQLASWEGKGSKGNNNPGPIVCAKDFFSNLKFYFIFSWKNGFAFIIPKTRIFTPLRNATTVHLHLAQTHTQWTQDLPILVRPQDI
jgi:hypothetical protein